MTYVPAPRESSYRVKGPLGALEYGVWIDAISLVSDSSELSELVDLPNSKSLQILVNESDCHAALANRGGDALYRAEPHIPTGKDTRYARFKEVRVAAM